MCCWGLIGVTVAVGAGVFAPVMAAESGDPTARSAVLDPAGDVYPLTTCPVSGEELGAKGEPVVLQHEGREVRFCCEGCIAKFQDESGKYLKAIDEAIVTSQIPYYPESICLNSRESWGDNPIDQVYKNRLLRFCCPSCGTEVMESIAKNGTHIPELDAMIVEQQRPDYPLQSCVVSGEALDGSHGAVIEFISGNRLIRLCCGACEKAFRKDPARYLAKLEEAQRNAGN
ncbi:MAG: hypothetical protein KJ060_03735 [Candidatus Hydrogenedentes bacterium]|nr:hypothetical protein [Candidatus Hydrogenedentota bacterium]